MHKTNINCATEHLTSQCYKKSLRIIWIASSQSRVCSIDSLEIMTKRSTISILFRKMIMLFTLYPPYPNCRVLLQGYWTIVLLTRCSICSFSVFLLLWLHLFEELHLWERRKKKQRKDKKWTKKKLYLFKKIFPTVPNNPSHVLFKCTSRINT